MSALESKPWYVSKTIWLNIISALIELGQVFLDLNILPSGTILLIINVLNIILRVITKTEVIAVKQNE